MPWDGAGGQNIEHSHTLVSISVKYILVLLAGELPCPATALISIYITGFVSRHYYTFRPDII